MNLFDSSFRIGWLVGLEWLNSNKRHASELINLLHIDTLWLESSRYHTAGYGLSPEIWQSSPFRNWKSQPGLSHHREIRGLSDSAFPVLPGILGGVDDSALKSAIDFGERLGLRLWGHLGFWSYAAMVYPQFGVRDFSGKPVSSDEDHWGACFCPSKPKINDWLKACLVDALENYPLTGIEIDHARFPPPASIPNLWTCVCEDCRKTAEQLGFNFEVLGQAIQEEIIVAKEYSSQRIYRLLKEAENWQDFLDAFIPTVRTWFAGRSAVLSFHLKDIVDFVKSSTLVPAEIGIDVFPPSVAFFGGHDYKDLNFLDFLTGGFGTIGWDQVATLTAEAWSGALLHQWPNLDQEKIYRKILGLMWDQKELFADNQRESLGANSEALEVKRFCNNWNYKSQARYPPLNVGGLSVGDIAEILSTIRQCDMDGVILANFEARSKEDLTQLGLILTQKAV